MNEGTINLLIVVVLGLLSPFIVLALIAALSAALLFAFLPLIIIVYGVMQGVWWVVAVGVVLAAIMYL
jgi:hypothetical protein